MYSYYTVMYTPYNYVLYSCMYCFLFIQVPLGILMKNENKTDQMVDILSHLHQYIPLKSATKIVQVPGTNDREVIKMENIHHVLLGGDQLTAERIRGAQNMRKNSTHAAGRLEGFIPVTEDWHAKVCFLQVMSTSNTLCN